MANHLAAQLFDPSAIPLETLRTLPVVKDLNLAEDDVNSLVEMQETIRTSVTPMLV